MSGRGAFVVLVGPDGVGKTSVASALWERASVRYFHFRPSGPWEPPTPGEILIKDVRPASLTSSVARLALNLLRFWWAYLTRIRPERDAGHLVVGDRWAFGYVARPDELRYFGPAWLARAAMVGFPQPDVVVCLVAPPEIIHSRKQELTVVEIEHDLEAWRSVPARRLVEIDATAPPAAIAQRILAVITPRGD